MDEVERVARRLHHFHRLERNQRGHWDSCTYDNLQDKFRDEFLKIARWALSPIPEEQQK
ncbi:hypothetical protein PQG67_07005 [Corynebacterium pseudodiphtheriticum]|uniref:hypothetical protein n=1 Tax=Corynebacterium pseudodiphtheriticum TaxID=37637 RepID=UPI00234CA064|nr:hypothetical protein [Corynebacterium pseudodiphtheriticum]MDC7086696.1 hypothetical protein [Corynebacterium pseudodiphtheriticum]